MKESSSNGVRAMIRNAPAPAIMRAKKISALTGCLLIIMIVLQTTKTEKKAKDMMIDVLLRVKRVLKKKKKNKIQCKTQLFLMIRYASETIAITKMNA